MKATRKWSKHVSSAAVVVVMGVWSAMCCGCGGGGGGRKTWETTFGGTGNDRGTSVRQTSDGGYIVAGYTNSFGAGDNDIYLVKTDSAGSPVWEQTYGGGSWEEAYSVQQTSDGGYIVAGETFSFGAGGYDMYLVKTDSAGTSQWQRLFGGAYNDVATSVQQTDDGGYIVAGYTNSFSVGDWDMYLVKTDSTGNVQWQRLFGGTGYDVGTSVQQTADGGYIVAGMTDSFDAGDLDMYLVKTDSAGDLEWQKTFGETGDDEASSVQQTDGGGYVVAGHASSFGAGGYDMYLVKTDGAGDLEWQNTFGGTGEDGAFSVQQTDEGGYIVAGKTDSFGAGGSDMYLVKTDGNGNL